MWLGDLRFKSAVFTALAKPKEDARPNLKLPVVTSSAVRGRQHICVPPSEACVFPG